MNKHSNNTSLPQAAITRRSILGGVALAAIPVATNAKAATPSIDDFLARASNAEKAWYHANSLAEIMEQMHPDHSFRSHINHEHQLALIIGDRRAKA